MPQLPGSSPKMCVPPRLQALVALCRVLLWHDFGVRWTLPAHSLCPTVPSRLNYLLWLDDLLIGAGVARGDHAILGIDIGTGASCIYPLLGVAHFGWRFIGTEVDAISVAAARHNVDLNAWSKHIEIRLVESPKLNGEVEQPPPILATVLGPTETAHFCMCNPPFYDLAEHPQSNAAISPHARCIATDGEQFTSGGQV